MGQTLSHGVYLPAEGERNCYSGLASNWNLLDTAIGDTAGKASATHTHGNITNDGKVGTAANKPLITGTDGAIQAGSFGTAANTFCEGNDSRLSDARTPVAHTHTKSDITDLFNSANTWTGENSFYALLPTQNGGNLGNASSRHFNGFFEGAFVYNQIKLNGDRGAWIVPVWSGASSGMQLLTSDGIKPLQIGVATTATDGRTVLDTSQGYINIYTGTDGTNNKIDILPMNSSVANLGNSTYKWKTLNGINPGALSLPNLARDGYIELSDNISANTEYAYTPTVDGWLALYVQTTGFHAENAVAIFNDSGSGSAYRWASSATSGINLARLDRYHGAVILPVRAGIPYLCWIKIDSSTTLTAKMLYFYKAAGNV